jgi:hypothetical protein
MPIYEVWSETKALRKFKVDAGSNEQACVLVERGKGKEMGQVTFELWEVMGAKEVPGKSKTIHNNTFRKMVHEELTKNKDIPYFPAPLKAPRRRSDYEEEEDMSVLLFLPGECMVSVDEHWKRDGVVVGVCQWPKGPDGDIVYLRKDVRVTKVLSMPVTDIEKNMKIVMAAVIEGIAACEKAAKNCKWHDKEQAKRIRRKTS